MSYSCIEYMNKGREEMVTVPSIWFDSFENQLYWPPTMDQNRIKRMMDEEVMPTQNWRSYTNAKVLYVGMCVFQPTIFK